jgi:hypothetical protein
MEEKIEVITREEFFRRYPPAERVIRITGGKDETVIPVGEDIVCDFCNDEITGDVHIYCSSHALCNKCGKRTIAEMCKK